MQRWFWSNCLLQINKEKIKLRLILWEEVNGLV